MKILLLGGTGMFGHKVYQVLRSYYEVKVSFRNYNEVKYGNYFHNGDVIDKIDAFNMASIKCCIESYKPDVLINCIGIIKQIKEAKDPKSSIYLNSLFPHLLSELCEQNNCKLIHISTDCVFSGIKGNYLESDISDAMDLYGKSKYLGEVNYNNHLTIRTSIIGHELSSCYSLVDWFISQNNGVVYGYCNAIYTGLPTVVLSSEIHRIIEEHFDLIGIYNISTDKISKYELLALIKEIYKLNIKLVKNTNFNCDRSLDCSSYKEVTGFTPMPWETMINFMYEDYLSTYINRGKYGF